MTEDADADPAATRDMPTPSRVPVAGGLHKPEGASGSGCLEVRCPNCHAPTEVAVDTSLTDLTCGSCGSHFSLVDQSKATRMAPSLSKLGRFELIERLGVGGFGSVWKARDKELDRTVAIKIPRAGAMGGVEQEQFFREARAAAQLRHPSIVSVHEVGRDGDSVYIVSDYVRGVTLGDWLTGQQLTSREAAELCAKIADALHHAHEQGVVHRDLKPANIMMDYDGQPHLMDFGLARRESGEVTMTMDGQVLGTPAYMSPEQAQGEAHTADRRSDVYSLGVILFQLLTGELPFRGNARMLIKQVIQDEPPSPRKLNGNVNKDLETITLKCLEKDPARRYTTARDLSDELHRYLHNKPIIARPVTRFGHLWKWAGRNRAVALLSALSTILVLLGTVASIIGYARELRLRHDAELSQQHAQENASLAQERLYNSLIATGDGRLQSQQFAEARSAFEEARTVAKTIGAPEIVPRIGWFSSYVAGPPSLYVYSKQAASTTVLTPDGNSLFVDGRQDIKQIDVVTGKVIRIFSCPGGVECLALTPDSTKLLSSSYDRHIKIWDVASAKELAQSAANNFPTYGILAIDNNSGISAGVDGIIRFWNLTNGKELRTINSPAGSLRAIALSPDGKFVATGSHDWRIALQEVESGNLLHLISAGAIVYSLAFTKDGAHLLSATLDGDVKIWNVKTGQLERRLRGHMGRVSALAISPDGKIAISAGSDQTIRVWKIETGEQVNILSGHKAPVYSIAITPDGTKAVSSGTDGTMLWTLTPEIDRQSFVQHRSNVAAISLAPGGKLAISGGDDRVLRLWDIATRQEICAWAAHESGIWCVAFLPDGIRALSGGSDHLVRLWDTRTGKQLRILGDTGGTTISLAVSTDGRRVVAGIQTKNSSGAVAWDMRSGNKEWQFNAHGKITFVAISDDGKLVLCGSSSCVAHLLSADTGHEIRALSGHKDHVTGVAFVGNDRRCLTASWDSSLKEWDVRDGKNIRTLNGHVGIIDCNLVKTADSAYVFSGAYDKTIRLWDIERGTQLRTIKFHDASINNICASPDGDLLLTASRDERAGILDFSTVDRFNDLENRLSAARRNSSEFDEGKKLSALGEWYAFRGEDAFAVECFKQARALGTSVSSLTLGRCDWRLGELADAQREFETAIHNDEAPRLYLERCLAGITSRMQATHDVENQAVEHSTGIIEQIRHNGHFANGLAVASRLGPQAIDDLIETAVIYKGEETSRPVDTSLLGELRLLGGKPQSAEAAIRAAIAKDSSKPFFYKSLGYCLLAQGKTDEARKAFQQAIKELARDGNKYDLEQATPDQMTAAYFLDAVDEKTFILHFASDEKLACYPWFYVAQRREIEGKKDAAIAAYEKCVKAGASANSNTVRALAEWRLRKLKESHQPGQK